MKQTILFADDDEPVRKMLARVLETAGYAVVHANTPSDAVRSFRAMRPDLVLLDLKLPDLAGWEAFDGILREHPTPIVVITSWPNQHEQARRRGIDALMEKPLDLPALLKTIHDLLAAQQKQEAARQLAGTAS